MHYGSVEYLVSSCYSGELIVPAKEVRSLMITANALELDDVKEKCADVLVSWLNPVNALEIKAFCGTLGCRKAVEECILSIQKHFVPITRSASFLKLSVDDLIAILEMDEIHVDAEESVYEAAARWLEADPGRAKHTWRVLKCARLSLVKPSFLVYVVSQHPLIREDLRCRDLVDEAKNCHLVLDGYIAPSLHSNPRFCKNMPGLVYAIGGLDTSGRWDAFECYDVREDKWEKLQPLSRKTCSLVAAAVGEKVYLLGGDNGRSAYSEVMVYSPSTTLWSPCCPMNAPRTGAAVAVLDGFIYVIGGCSGSTVYDSVIRYSPKEGKWEDMPSMTESRCWCAASILNGKIYVCGGSTTNIYHGDPGCYLNSVECFDPKTSSWSSVTPMKRERFHVALVAGPDSLYAIGGSDSDAPSMEIYHETTNEWELQPLPDNFPTRGAGAVVLPMPVDELC
ncbi:kelch repeat protein [Ancylostoma duodenale]|uniref:Kelch repeat protein n=1 Tax=Ancylostoma duodenale TaxID=51022 RepID=A0A0C2GLP4_9BILA|nr:kelch repeat protein [Ancylostoma duodenale]